MKKLSLSAARLVCVCASVCDIEPMLTSNADATRVLADHKRICSYEADDTEPTEWMFSPLAQSHESSVSVEKRFGETESEWSVPAQKVYSSIPYVSEDEGSFHVHIFPSDAVETKTTLYTLDGAPTPLSLALWLEWPDCLIGAHISCFCLFYIQVFVCECEHE